MFLKHFLYFCRSRILAKSIAIQKLLTLSKDPALSARLKYVPQGKCVIAFHLNIPFHRTVAKKLPLGGMDESILNVYM